MILITFEDLIMKWLQPIQQLDLAIFQWCLSTNKKRDITRISQFVSKTADGWLYLLFLFSIQLVPNQSDFQYSRLFIAAFVFERIIYLVLKNCFRRNRPADAIQGFKSSVIPSDKFSFPSGHTSAAFLFTVLVSGVYPVVYFELIFWAICVGMSRVFLGVHFPFDTIVGAILGSSVGLLVLKIGYLL